VPMPRLVAWFHATGVACIGEMCIETDTSLLASDSKAGEMINHFAAWQQWRKTAEIEKID